MLCQPLRPLGQSCGYRKSAHAPLANLAVTTFMASLLNLGMCFSNTCGMPLNLRRMEWSIAMIIMTINRGSRMARVAIQNCRYGRRRHDNIDARFVNRNRSSAEGRLSSDLGEAAAKQAQKAARSARCA